MHIGGPVAVVGQNTKVVFFCFFQMLYIYTRRKYVRILNFNDIYV